MFSFIKSGKNSNRSAAIVDPAKIESLLTRRVEKMFPSVEFLRDKLMKGERLTLYCGFDPTSPSLHMGHAVSLRKLREFQELGHQVIMLIGDFTGMIGDPTDKSETRKQLTKEQVLQNCKLYKKQASKFLRFTGKNKAILKFNSKWLAKLNFAELINLCSLVTVDQMLKRDMFVRRMEEGRPIYLHEFLYPLMQGYDSVAMGVDGEVGGNDQTFNMLAGRDLSKALNGKDKFVIANKLMTDASGKKMGKTDGNAVSLNMTASETFGKIMSWSDAMIISGFDLCTDTSLAEIQNIKLQLEKGENPKILKMRLAREVTAMYHGVKESEKAEADFNNAFGGEKTAEAIESLAKEITVPHGSQLGGVLVEQGVVASKAEFRRLVLDGAVSVIDPNKPSEDIKIKDPHYTLTADTYMKIGKRRFVKFNIAG